MGFAKERIAEIASDTLNKLMTEHFNGVARDIDTSDIWSNVMCLGFDVAEVATVAAHDWGHYRLSSLISEQDWRFPTAVDDWWIPYVDKRINEDPANFQLPRYANDFIAEAGYDEYEAYDTIAFASPIYCEEGEEVGVKVLNKVAQAIRVLEKAGFSY
jgi:hypothetical protein